jgi:hypothetical protein
MQNKIGYLYFTFCRADCYRSWIQKLFDAFSYICVTAYDVMPSAGRELTVTNPVVHTVIVDDAVQNVVQVIAQHTFDAT